METGKVVTIQRAGDALGITDLRALRAAAKKYGALLIISGIAYVDLDRFNQGVEQELPIKAAQVARRARRGNSSGHNIGLLRARIKRAPDLIQAKKVALDQARKQVAQAPNQYEKSRAKEKVAGFEAGLHRLEENLIRDEAELDRILNQPEEEQ